MAGAYKTGKYRNIFKEYGYPEEEIQKRVEDTFNTCLLYTSPSPRDA